jgi:hypothetical protein
MNTHALPQRAAPETGGSGPALQKCALSITAIVAFFVLAFVWSWGIGFAASQVKAQSVALSTALLMLSGFGPSIAGFAVVARFSGGAGLRHWLARCLNRRVGWRWFALAFLAPPAVMLCALAIHAGLGGAIGAPAALDNIPMAIANFGLVLLIGGPLGEEFGWRGYAMPALAARSNWRTASLFIGVFWGLWHLPLFFMAGTAQSQMPIAVFMLNILAGSVLFGWLFVRSGGSILPAIILHMSLNTWAGILVIVPTATTGQPYVIVTGLLVLIAVSLLLTPDRTMAKGGVRC